MRWDGIFSDGGSVFICEWCNGNLAISLECVGCLDTPPRGLADRVRLLTASFAGGVDGELRTCSSLQKTACVRHGCPITQTEVQANLSCPRLRPTSAPPDRQRSRLALNGRFFVVATTPSLQNECTHLRRDSFQRSGRRRRGTCEPRPPSTSGSAGLCVHL
jgi:hypothetical protein